MEQEHPEQISKPPIGVMPEWRHKELRVEDIDEAIERFVEANRPIPQNWIDEKCALQKWLSEHFKSQPDQPDWKEKAELDILDITTTTTNSKYDITRKIIQWIEDNKHLIR